PRRSLSPHEARLRSDHGRGARRMEGGKPRARSCVTQACGSNTELHPRTNGEPMIETTIDHETAATKSNAKPIASYGLLSDCNSAALAGRDGSIDWLCLPRFDSPAVFSRILDPDAGHFSITPLGSYSVERRYITRSLVLETTFTTETGSVVLRDALAFAAGQRGHALGFDAPHELLR